MTPKVQDLSKFKLPVGFRGKSAPYVQLWWFVQSTLFKWSPQFAYPFRAQLLRMFGAKIGSHTVIRPTVTVTYPWKITIGDYVWIGDDAVLYSLGDIFIGDHSVVSQRSYLCAADHDYNTLEFIIQAKSIRIGRECWIAAESFIAPGVTIGDKAVIGAKSCVLKDQPEAMLCAGNPCKPIKSRYP
jgi:putative colanic acid biosynthesis acetyltransferase WcaF